MVCGAGDEHTEPTTIAVSICYGTVSVSAAEQKGARDTDDTGNKQTRRHIHGQKFALALNWCRCVRTVNEQFISPLQK
jgi:hypothetical protein